MIQIRGLILAIAATSAVFFVACGDDDGGADASTPTQTPSVSQPAATASPTPTPTPTTVATPTSTATPAPTEAPTPPPAPTIAATQAPAPPAPPAPQPTQVTQAPPPAPVATEAPPPPPAPLTVGVTMRNLAFVPGSVTVPAGSTVVWTNQDQFPHDATSNGGAFASGTLQAGDSFSMTFSAPGTYGYLCTIHPFMTGTVVVN